MHIALQTPPVLCPLCGGEQAIARKAADPVSGDLFTIIRCCRCGVGITRPAPADLAPYYPAAYYGSRHGATSGLCLRRRLRLLPTTPGSLLDVGCGDGSFLVAARSRGWCVTGLERAPDAARAHGITIHTTTADFVGCGFDAITLWHSLEHFPDPLQLLQQLTGLLNPNGVIIIAVPNFSGWQARLFGRGWLHLDVPRHLWHFSRQALLLMLQQCHLTPIAIRHCEFEYDLLGWSQSLLNTLHPDRANEFFHLLTRKPTRSGTMGKLYQLVAGAIFTTLALPLLPLSAIAGKGGTLLLTAKESALMGEMP